MRETGGQLELLGAEGRGAGTEALAGQADVGVVDAVEVLDLARRTVRRVVRAAHVRRPDHRTRLALPGNTFLRTDSS